MSSADRDERRHSAGATHSSGETGRQDLNCDTSAAAGDPRAAGQSPAQATLRGPESSRRLPAILLLGMPGTGKGTQGRLLGSMNGLVHMSTGEIFRGLDRSSQDGQTVRDLIDNGDLVPDELAVRIWKQHVDAAIDAGTLQPDRDVLILDGIPRSVRQCALVEPVIDVLAVVHLSPSSDEPIVERLMRRSAREGRADDASEEVIRHRIRTYRQTTAPVLDYYPAEIVHTVDPLGTPVEVKKRVLESIIPYVKRRIADDA